ncbi:sensor histidine kinase [Flavobacterium ardleyense]|uniref:histidine kinase n=1 Tax=Flavobacterium ardleyense TaxID=2038737 RepID=A0ABW5Z765_9FLAO
MVQQGTEALLLAILGLFSLCVVMVFLFVIFQKKKNVLLMHQTEAARQYEKEIIESQVEIREQTLRNISWELHDNIGQLLTLAKIQLQSVKENPHHITDVNDNLTTIINEVRSLSKSINPDYISKINLSEAVQIEIDRFNKLNYIKASLTTKGDIFQLDKKAEIIIFRILQEFFSNTIKHSKATELAVEMEYVKNKLYIKAIDNGRGFEVNNAGNNGIGLTNMKKRGALINAEVAINSEIDTGTSLIIALTNTR